MKVVIFAGGLGTRISEESHLKPKPMIEIGDKPVLWHIMKIYEHFGFNDFIICLGYEGMYCPENSHFWLLKLNIPSIIGDINNQSKLESVFQIYKPDVVFHLAAKTLVIESYSQPFLTYQTNVLGTLSVLESARKCKSVKVFINVTSDKVYENYERKKPLNYPIIRFIAPQKKK